MNFVSNLKEINKDFSNSFYAKYLKGQWGIVAGFNTYSSQIVMMQKRLADWQTSYDCNNQLCTLSQDQPIVIVVYGEKGISNLNPPLISCNTQPYLTWVNRIREIVINVFKK